MAGAREGIGRTSKKEAVTVRGKWQGEGDNKGHGAGHLPPSSHFPCGSGGWGVNLIGLSNNWIPGMENENQFIIFCT